jgi:transcription elongation factor Elf1
VILLFGTRASESLLVVVAFVCNFCGQHARQEVYERVNRFTLFFIPLFRISTRYFVTCSNCGGTTELNRAQVDNSMQWARSNPQVQQGRPGF